MERAHEPKPTTPNVLLPVQHEEVELSRESEELLIKMGEEFVSKMKNLAYEWKHPWLPKFSKN